MSHIAKFNLSLEDEARLRAALGAVGCKITEGHFEIPSAWRSMNTGTGNKINSQGHVTQWDGKPVVFGFTVTPRGRVNGAEQTRYGFTRDTDGSLCLVGDGYGMGMGLETVQNAISNSYVNEGVNETVPVLEALGYVEQTAENTVVLDMLVQ